MDLTLSCHFRDCNVFCLSCFLLLLLLHSFLLLLHSFLLHSCQRSHRGSGVSTHPSSDLCSSRCAVNQLLLLHYLCIYTSRAAFLDPGLWFLCNLRTIDGRPNGWEPWQLHSYMYIACRLLSLSQCTVSQPVTFLKRTESKRGKNMIYIKFIEEVRITDWYRDKSIWKCFNLSISSEWIKDDRLPDWW